MIIFRGGSFNRIKIIFIYIFDRSRVFLRIIFIARADNLDFIFKFPFFRVLSENIIFGLPALDAIYLYIILI